MSDHANNAAAVAAGWIRTQIDNGAGKTPRFVTRYTKPVVGEPGGSSGQELRAEGHDQSSQAAADTNALNALNKQRALRYGAGATGGQGGHGGSLTHDTH